MRGADSGGRGRTRRCTARARALVWAAAASSSSLRSLIVPTVATSVRWIDLRTLAGLGSAAEGICCTYTHSEALGVCVRRRVTAGTGGRVRALVTSCVADRSTSTQYTEYTVNRELQFDI
jgi:hypothetical protein